MTMIPAQPYPFPFAKGRTALVVIDMQRDFIEPGGFGEALGNDVSTLMAAVQPVARLLALFRRMGWPIIHTRESHLPDLSDCPPAKLSRGKPGLRIGDDGPWAASWSAGSRATASFRPAHRCRARSRSTNRQGSFLPH